MNLGGSLPSRRLSQRQCRLERMVSEAPRRYGRRLESASLRTRHSPRRINQGRLLSTAGRTTDNDATELSQTATSVAGRNHELLRKSADDHYMTKAKHVNSISAYSELAKAKLSALVVTTTAAGFVAAGEPLQYPVLISCLLGTALCSSSAAALNQIFERHRDARMKRTQQRPLVVGNLAPSQATAAAAVWGASGTTLLAVGTDPVTAALGAGNIALYAGLYTYLKPRSVLNTWVGAVVGAIPPVMGWTAAAATASSGSLDTLLLSLSQHPHLDTAVILGSTLYLWQMPHFFALSYMHRVDYKRGGFQMVPVVETSHDRTAQIIIRYTWYLSAVPWVAMALDTTSSMFAIETVALNAYALHVAHKFGRDRTNGNARRVFLTSLWYLPCWLTLFLLHAKVWDDEATDKEPDAVLAYLRDQVHAIRARGRQLCWHETVEKQEAACPVVVTRRHTHEAVQGASAAVAATSEQVATVRQEQQVNGSQS